MYVYILSDEENSVVKVGITSRKVFERVKDINSEQKRYNFVVFGAKSFQTHLARDIEKKLLSVVSNIGEPLEFYFGGCTECFVVPDVNAAESILWNLLDSYVTEDVVVKTTDEVKRTIDKVYVDLAVLDKFPSMSLTDLLVMSTIALDQTMLVPEIAKNLNIAGKTVERSVKKLCSLGLLEVSRITISGCVARNQYNIKEIS